MADSPTLKPLGDSPPLIASINSPPKSTPPPPPPQRTPSLSRDNSISFADEPLLNSTSPSLNPFEFESSSGRPQGLGITGRTPSISRVPVGTRSPRSPPSKQFYTGPSSGSSSPYTPASHSNPFLSPKPDQHTYSFSGGGGRGLPPLQEDEVDLSTGKNTPSPYQEELLSRGSSDGARGNPSPSVGGSLNEEKHEHDGCASRRDIHSSRKNWLSVSILILSVYSTVFSGLYLVVALMQPRYGKSIMSGGKLTPETASVLFALFAKTIELSFVSVFVAFLGQVLSRRSLIKLSRGVTVAELTMRNWVIQPAFMITHWETLRHTGLTFLGLLTLTNAFVAMFYTTASDSLVSPHLKFGHWKEQEMVGLVETAYAVPNYVNTLCHNPIASMDPVYAGTTCLAVLHAGQAHSNHITFLDDWVRVAAGGPVDPSNRPDAPAMLYDNTTVIGSWISKEWSDMSWSYKQFNRVIDNVTMAMPHAGIFAAARHEQNEIMQPENLAGVGEYRVKAAVVSPAVNVLCVNLNQTELSPLIYVTWPNAKFNTGEQIPGQRLPIPSNDWTLEAHPKPGKKFMNRTVVDDIFEWGLPYGYQPPTFPMFPIEYNSILNASFYTYGSTDSIYLLFKAPNTITKDYTVCKLRSVITPACSTHYNVSGTAGGQMKSNCEDAGDNMSYERSVPGTPSLFNKDWINVGSELVRALSLGTGISNANASSSRLITQLVTKDPAVGEVATRNGSMPTISESLAVMAGSTLLLSSTDATFYHYWNFTNATLDTGILLPFNASIQSQEYTSGFVARWTILFYLILIIVFCTNIFCLIYFILQSGLVTDYSEPQNLFALAVNSPASRRLGGSCGAGPEGNQFNVDWHVMHDDNSGHFFIKEGKGNGSAREAAEEEMMEGSGGVLRQRSLRSQSSRSPSIRPGQLKSVKSYGRLSTNRTSWL